MSWDLVLVEHFKLYIVCLSVFQRMTGQLRLLNLACASKARPRTVTLTRATRDEILYFQILGGLERGCGIFIKKVEKDSKAYEAGLKRGDQVCTVIVKYFCNILVLNSVFSCSFVLCWSWYCMHFFYSKIKALERK